MLKRKIKVVDTSGYVGNIYSLSVGGPFSSTMDDVGIVLGIWRLTDMTILGEMYVFGYNEIFQINLVTSTAIKGQLA